MCVWRHSHGGLILTATRQRVIQGLKLSPERFSLCRQGRRQENVTRCTSSHPALRVLISSCSSYSQSSVDFLCGLLQLCVPAHECAKGLTGSSLSPSAGSTSARICVMFVGVYDVFVSRGSGAECFRNNDSQWWIVDTDTGILPHTGSHGCY